MRFVFFLLLFQNILFSSEAQWIAKRIFQNECGGKEEKLLWWNEGESFASCGIGHFIWYPEGKEGPFTQTFPALLSYLEKRAVALPSWLSENRYCPWHSKEAFFSSSESSKKQQLRTLLLETLDLQFEFIEERFHSLLTTEFKEDAELKKKIEQLSSSKEGRYALLDYLNFKGSGTSSQERYAGYGWGLKQVLEEIEGEATLENFVEVGKKVLKRRVANAPKERLEERWLPGWLNRLDSYKR